MKISKILLLIIFLASFLRLYSLSSYPALNADEAALGYNAYSLIETGRDEHGNAWPIHFESFGDYKPGLTVYLILPVIKIFGLNVLSVRIIPALLGVATVLLLYFIVLELFKDKKFALASSFFLAISPWHIHFSRGAWEVNVATFFIIAGILAFLKASKNSKFYIASMLAFVFSMYTYHAARIITPLLLIGLFIFNYKIIHKNIKKILSIIIVAIILLLPLAKNLVSPNGFSRASSVSIFSDEGIINRINENRGKYENPNGIFPRLLHNKIFGYSSDFISNWFNHYSPDFLFFTGDEIQRNKVPNMGQMYSFEIILIAIALFVILKNKIHKNWRLILYWLLIAPIAASLTFQSPHALRAHNMVIPITIISAYGFVTVCRSARKYIKFFILTNLFYVCMFILISANLSRYLCMYWQVMSEEYPYSSQYGVKELVDFVKENQSDYEKVIATNRYDQPYILFLFYLKYPPEKFQKEHVLTPRDEFGFSTVNNFNKYFFEKIKINNTIINYPNSLIAGTSEEITKDNNIIETINFPNGQPAFKIVSNK